MASPRQSNVDRRRERDICRQALSKHIVKPSEVRLSPRPQDGYGWRPCPGYESGFSLLFTKNLSDHSISTYRFLSRQVGNTFEAVPAEAGAEDTNLLTLVRGRPVCSEYRALTVSSTARPSAGFSAEIDRLHQENAALAGHVQELSVLLQNETESKLCVEKENGELRKSLKVAEDGLNERAEKARYCQTSLLACFDELDRTVPILAELRRIAVEEAAL
ncbi:hypothetical protein ARSEF4850_008188 [Beauveria asiatica]